MYICRLFFDSCANYHTRAWHKLANRLCQHLPTTAGQYQTNEIICTNWLETTRATNTKSMPHVSKGVSCV